MTQAIEAFEKEANTLKEKIKKNIELECSWFNSINQALDAPFVFSLFPVVPFVLYLINSSYNVVTATFLQIWLVLVVFFGAIKMTFYFIHKKSLKNLDPKVKLSVYAYSIYSELKNHTNAKDQDIFKEAQMLNRWLIEVWRTTYIVNGKLTFFEEAQSSSVHEAVKNGLVLKLENLKELSRLQKTLPLYHLDQDASVFFDTLTAVENRLMKNLSAGFNFPEFVDGYFYLSKLFYLLRKDDNSLSEVKDTLENLTKVLQTIAPYKPVENKIDFSFADLIIFCFRATYASKYRAVKLICWFITLFPLSLIGMKSLVIPYLNIVYTDNALTILAIVVTISGGASVFLASKEKE